MSVLSETLCDLIALASADAAEPDRLQPELQDGGDPRVLPPTPA